MLSMSLVQLVAEVSSSYNGEILTKICSLKSK